MNAESATLKEFASHDQAKPLSRTETHVLLDASSLINLERGQPFSFDALGESFGNDMPDWS